MDRQTVYPGQILPETALLQMTKDAMISVAKLSSAVMGTSTIANGFAVVPTGPASLQVICGPGEIYSMASVDSLAFSSLPADTTHSILKQGILLDGVTLNCPAPGTTGQSINYLIEVTYQDTDSTPVLLPYYNSANPALPFSGMGNNGLTQNTSRKGSAIVAVKPGASATTGSQVTPAPDAGYVGLYVVTVAFGQTTITSANISQYSGAPLLPAGILPSIQAGRLNSATDIGTANAYAANFTPAIPIQIEGMAVCIKVANSNTGASTFTPAPGVISPAPIVGAAHSALQGGEIFATGDLWLQWNSSVGSGSWIILDSTGGSSQVAAATKSLHAMQLGQATGRLINVQRFISGTSTYVPTAGTNSIIVEVVGGGGSGAGAGTTAAGQVSLGSGGGAGGYAKSRLTSGFSGASVIVGAGGAQSSSTGNGGGTTSFGGTIAAGGGVGGALFTATGTYPLLALGGLGGNASGGSIVSQDGGQGGAGFAFTSTNMASGAGGMSAFGAGGGSVTGSASGLNASGFGAGGGGGSNNNAGAVRASGAGSGGLVVIWEFS